jgi:hypothetical protein
MDVEVKTTLMAVTCLLLVTGSPLLAQDEPLLGEYHFTAELGAMVMQHVTFETDDAGVHAGLDAYKHVGQNWYLGAEIGFGGSIGFLAAESDIAMYALNGKRVFGLGRVVRLDLGAGLSYNHVSYSENNLFGPDDGPEIDEWIFGAQALANLHLKLGWALLGAHVKYMLTQDVPGVAELEELEKGWDYSNLTIGVQAGFLIR